MSFSISTSRFLACRFPLLLATSLFCVVPCWAQNDDEIEQVGTTALAGEAAHDLRDVANLDAAALDDLPALLNRYPTALTVQVTRDTLQKSAAWPRLRDWVQRGGVVFLHNDAAQLFGYGTVPARLSRPEMAGQLFGRARAAWPWGAQPLLNGPRPVETVFYQMPPGDHLVNALNGATALLRVSDLADLDAGAPNAAPLFAAAIAPFGRGWAVFAPQIIETHRGEGAIFSTQLWQLATARSPAPRPENAEAEKPLQTYLALGAEVFEAALPPQLLREPRAANVPPATTAEVDFVALQNQLDALLRPRNTNETNDSLRDAAQPNQNTELGAPKRDGKAQPALMLSSEEVDAMAQLAHQAADPQAPALVRARGLARLEIWRARWELQQPGGGAAAGWLDAAAQQLTPPDADNKWKPRQEDIDAAPEFCGIAFWQGVLNCAPALDVLSDAVIKNQLYGHSGHSEPTRAQMWQSVADGWQFAARADDEDVFALSGTQEAWLKIWATEADKRAALLDLYPTNREIQGDSQLPLMLASDEPASRDVPTILESGLPELWLPMWLGMNPGTNNWGISQNTAKLSQYRIITGVKLGVTLAAASRALGWRADREEAIVLPTPDHYRQFRNVQGPIAQVRLPAAGVDALISSTDLSLYAPDPLGNVVGQQMLMTSLFQLKAADPEVDTEGRRIGLPHNRAIGTGTPSIAGWMHAQVLINALAEGGAPVPLWIRDGLGALSAYETLRAANLQTNDIELASDDAARAFLIKQGNLLAPRDFAGLSRKPNTASPLDTIATAQSMRMMRFFYNRFGAGAVVETLQRLGAGQNIDAALNATTGLNQNAFFAAWRAAETSR